MGCFWFFIIHVIMDFFGPFRFFCCRTDRIFRANFLHFLASYGWHCLLRLLSVILKIAQLKQTSTQIFFKIRRNPPQKREKITGVCRDSCRSTRQLLDNCSALSKPGFPPTLHCTAAFCSGFFTIFLYFFFIILSFLSLSKPGFPPAALHCSILF